MVIGYTKAILWSDRLRHNIIQNLQSKFSQTLFFHCSEDKLSSFYVIIECAKNIVTASSYRIFGIDAGVNINFSYIFIYYNTYDDKYYDIHNSVWIR